MYFVLIEIAYKYIGVRGSPERDISSLGTLVDGGWTGLGVLPPPPLAHFWQNTQNRGASQKNVCVFIWKTKVL